VSHSSSFEILPDEHGLGSILLAKGPWNRECSERLSQGDVSGVRLSYSAGFRGGDLEFLASFRELRSVEIYSNDVRDLSPLAALNGLEVLGLQTQGKTKFHHDWFPRLRIAKLQWRPGMDALLECHAVNYLNIINFPFVDLLPLKGLSLLERLYLTSRKLTSLAGIECLHSLRHLDLYACPYLISVEPLKNCPNIVKVEIESCRHIPNRNS